MHKKQKLLYFPTLMTDPVFLWFLLGTTFWQSVTISVVTEQFCRALCVICLFALWYSHFGHGTPAKTINSFICCCCDSWRRCWWRHLQYTGGVSWLNPSGPPTHKLPCAAKCSPRWANVATQRVCHCSIVVCVCFFYVISFIVCMSLCEVVWTKKTSACVCTLVSMFREVTWPPPPPPSPPVLLQAVSQHTLRWGSEGSLQGLSLPARAGLEATLSQISFFCIFFSHLLLCLSFNISVTYTCERINAGVMCANK